MAAHTRLDALRVLLTSTLALVATLLCNGRALAGPEICPARTTPFIVAGGAGNGPAQTFGFRLFAHGARSTSGSIAVLTDQGWYRLAYPNVTLVSENAEKDTLFVSSLLYARFDKPVSIREAWIEQATATGDTVGWEKEGLVACDPPDVDPFHPAIKRFDAIFPGFDPTPATILVPSPETAPTFFAKPASAIETTDCAKPFVDATMKSAVTPELPDSVRESGLMSGTTYIEEVVGSDGRLLYAGVMISSGSSTFDLASLRAARESSYSPAIAFCRPIKGRFVFRGEFR